MNKIILSSVMALGLLVAATTATMAVFSDEDQVLGNTISVAHLTIDAREVHNKPMMVSNLLPGQWGDSGAVDLYNDGNVAQRQWMYVENIQGDLCDYVYLKLGYSFNVPSGTWNFDHVYGTYKLSDLVEANKMLVGRSDPVAANNTTRLVQQAYLDTTTPNSFNVVPAPSCTWDEIFVATQPGM